MNLRNYLQTQTKATIALLALGLTVLVGGLDFWTGPQYSFTLFYLFPVALAAWYTGKRTPILVASLSAGLAVAANDLHSSAIALDTLIWNGALRLGIFLVVALLVTKLRAAYANLEQQVADRTASLTEEIARRQQAEAAAKLQFAQIAMDKMLDAAYWVRADGRFVYVNDSACELLGYTRPELLELGVPDVDPNFPREKWPTVWDELSKTKHWVFETRHRKKNGNLLPIEMTVSFLENDGTGYLCGIARDLTARRQAEAALQATEQRYRLLYESVRDAVVSVDMHGHILETNRAFQDLTGYSAAELQQLTYVDLTPEKWHALEAQIVADQILPLGHSGIYEKEYRRKDGTLLAVELRTVLLRDAAGQPSTMWAIVRDITARKRTEAALHASEARAAMFAAATFEGIVESSDGRILDCNDQFAQMVGYSVAELKGQEISTLITPEARPFVMEAIRQNRESGSEHSMIRKDGTRIFVETHGRPLAPGSAIRHTALRDITVRKQVEAALRKSEERLRVVLDNSLDLIYRRNIQTDRYDFMSPAIVLVTGYQIDEIVGTSGQLALERFHPDDRSQIQAMFERAVSGQLSSGSLEYRFRHKDGHYRWLSDRFTILKDPTGQPLYWLGVSRDVTAHKQLEQSLQVSELRYRTLFEQAADAIVLFDPVTLAFVDFNDEAHRRLGYTRAEFANLKISDIDLLEDAAAVRRRISIPLNTTFEFETKHRTKTGAVLNVIIRTRRINIGDTELVQAVWTDITERSRIQIALLDEREKLQLAIEGSHGAPWEIPMDPTQPMQALDTIQGSPRLKSFIGFRDDEFPNSVAAWFDRIHPDDVIAIHANGQALQEGRTAAQNIEYRIRHKDGSWRWIASQRRLFRDPAGHPVRWSGIDWDITDRKEVEVALQESDALFRQFLRHSPIYTFIKLVSPTESRVLHASDNFREMVGIAGPDLLGKTMTELFPPDLAAKITADDWAVVNSGQVLKVDEELNGRSYSSIKYPIVQHGRTLLAGYTIDITDRKRLEAELTQLVQERTQALQVTRQWLQKLYDSSQDAIVISEITGRILEFNHAFETLTGYTAAEIRELTFYQLTPPEFRDLNQRVITTISQTGEAARFEKEYFRKDGTRVPVALTLWPMRDSAGQWTQLAAIISDVTEQHRLQRGILEVSELERRRIGQDLHDSLCQMLTATTFAMGALEERLATKNAAAAQSAHEIGELLRRANSEARNIARGLFPIELEAGGLIAAIQRLADEITQTGKARCEFICDPDVMIANPMQALHIYRITQEAVANALRHGAATTIVIVLKLANDQIFLEVANNGRDWPIELAAPGQSPGMGLSIMAYRARMIGGTLQVCRGNPGGTMVELSFPVTKPV